MGRAGWRRDGEDMPYLLSCGEGGELERETERGVVCGDGEGNGVSSLTLWLIIGTHPDI